MYGGLSNQETWVCLCVNGGHLPLLCRSFILLPASIEMITLGSPSTEDQSYYHISDSFYPRKSFALMAGIKHPLSCPRKRQALHWPKLGEL